MRTRRRQGTVDPSAEANEAETEVGINRFVVNPAAGAGRSATALARLRRIASENGSSLHASQSAQDLDSLIRAAVADGVERLIAVGGDGTFHHAIQALAGTDVELALVPMGSGNDLASSLGVPRKLEAAVDLALHGRARTIDLGEVDGRFFGVYCGVGFDSEVARWVAERGPSGSGLGYVLGVLRTLVGFSPPSIEAEHDLGHFAGRAMFVTVANCPTYGGGMRIAPEADPGDGLLDVVVVREVSRLELLRVFPRVFRGSHVDHPAVSIHRTRSARIRLDREMVMFADGEALRPVAGDWVEMKIRRDALRVVVE